MATASCHPASIATPRSGAGRLAKPGLFAMFGAILERWRSAAEKPVFARFVGCGWCDTVERQVNDALINR